MVAHRKVFIKTQREMWPFQYARHVFNFQFKEYHRRYDLGDQNSPDFDPLASEGWQKFKSAGLVFMAFWAESYINYALSEIYADKYSSLEKNPTLNKLKLISDKIDFSYDKNIFEELFNFRNSLAHGKKFNAASQDEMSLDNYNSKYSGSITLPFVPKSEWELYLAKVDEKGLEKEFIRVFDDIHDAAGLNLYANGLGDITSQSAIVRE